MKKSTVSEPVQAPQINLLLRWIGRLLATDSNGTQSPRHCPGVVDLFRRIVMCRKLLQLSGAQSSRGRKSKFVPRVLQRLMPANWFAIVILLLLPFLCLAQYTTGVVQGSVLGPIGRSGQGRFGRAEEPGNRRGPHLSHHGQRPLFFHRCTARQIPPSRHGDRLCFSVRQYRHFHQPNHHTELHAADRTGVHHRQRPGGYGAAARCLRSLARRHLQRNRGRHTSQPQPQHQQSGDSCVGGHANLQSTRRGVYHRQWRAGRPD